jgi:hypothetical protein
LRYSSFITKSESLSDIPQTPAQILPSGAGGDSDAFFCAIGGGVIVDDPVRLL